MSYDRQLSPRRAANILVIAREPLLREMICNTLAATHPCVAGAAGSLPLPPDPERVDVAVVDLDLPQSRGMALLRELWSRHPRAVVVAVVSRTFYGEALERLRRRGVVLAVERPFNASTLLAAVHAALVRCAYASNPAVLALA